MNAATRRTTLALTLLVLAAAVEPAAAQERPDRPVIRVSGTGQVQAAPDVAHVSFAVETFAQTAREAGRTNAEQMERVIRALREAGAAEDDIETSGYGVHAVYEPHRPRQETGGVVEDPRIRGYRATNQVTVEIRALDTVGRFIDAGLAGGANRLGGVRFELRDSQAAHAEALRQAIQRARASAEVMASALGVRLGAPIDVSTQVETPTIWQHRAAPAMEMAMDEARTPISPADQTVSANVTIVFAME